MERYGITKEEMSDETLTAVVEFIRKNIPGYCDYDCDQDGYREYFSRDGFIEDISKQFNLTTENELGIIDLLIDEVRWERTKQSAYECGIII